MKPTYLKSVLPFAAIFSYVLFYFIYSQPALFEQNYTIAGDFPQHLIWLFTFEGNYFQANDPLVAFSALIQPWGLYGFYRLLVIFFDPLAVSRFMPFFLLLTTCWFTYLLLQKRFGWAIAFAGVLLMSHIPFGEMVGAFARSYAYPLLLGFLYFWIERKVFLAALILILSALFYPTICLVAAGIVALFYIRKLLAIKSSNWKIVPRNLLIPAVLLVCGGILLLKSHQISSNALAGELFDQTVLETAPEFQPGGRVNFNFHPDIRIPLKFPWHWYLRLPYAKILFAFSLVLLIVALIKKPEQRLFDWTLLSLLISGTVLYFLAILFLPKLFIPARYLYYSYLPFLYLLFLRALAWAKSWWLKSVPGLILIGIVAYSVWHNNTSENHGLGIYDQYQVLYEKIKEIRQPVLIAGPPVICNQIPTFCRQSVLFSEEAAHAIYFKNYHQLIESKIDDFILAYTSSDIETVLNFVEENQIDYLIIDYQFFEAGHFRIYEPHWGELKALTKGRTRADYALSQLPDSLTIKCGERYALLDCRELLELFK